MRTYGYPICRLVEGGGCDSAGDARPIVGEAKGADEEGCKPWRSIDDVGEVEQLGWEICAPQVLLQAGEDGREIVSLGDGRAGAGERYAVAGGDAGRDDPIHQLEG